MNQKTKKHVQTLCDFWLTIVKSDDCSPELLCDVLMHFSKNAFSTYAFALYKSLPPDINHLAFEMANKMMDELKVITAERFKLLMKNID